MSQIDDLSRKSQAEIEAESRAVTDRIQAETEAYWQRVAADFLWRTTPLESRTRFKGKLVKVDRFSWLRRLVGGNR